MSDNDNVVDIQPKIGQVEISGYMRADLWGELKTSLTDAGWTLAEGHAVDLTKSDFDVARCWGRFVHVDFRHEPRRRDPNKYERALDEIRALLVEIEKRLGATGRSVVTHEDIAQARLLHRAIEHTKYGKQPEFDNRFAQPPTETP